LPQSEVSDGHGGLKLCEATLACPVPSPEPTVSQSHGMSGDYAPGYGPNADVTGLMQQEVDLLKKIIEVMKQLLAKHTNYIWQISTGVE
jgi:hypothetical protein